MRTTFITGCCKVQILRLHSAHFPDGGGLPSGDSRRTPNLNLTVAPVFSRGGEAVSFWAHNPAFAGSNPAPVTHASAVGKNSFAYIVNSLSCPSGCESKVFPSVALHPHNPVDVVWWYFVYRLKECGNTSPKRCCIPYCQWQISPCEYFTGFLIE